MRCGERASSDESHYAEAHEQDHYPRRNLEDCLMRVCDTVTAKRRTNNVRPGCVSKEKLKEWMKGRQLEETQEENGV